MPTNTPKSDRELLDLDAVLDLTRRASDVVLPRGVRQAFEVMGLRAAARVRMDWVEAMLQPAPAPTPGT